MESEQVGWRVIPTDDDDDDDDDSGVALFGIKQFGLKRRQCSRGLVLAVSKADQRSVQGVCLVPRPHGFPKHYYWLNMAKKTSTYKHENRTTHHKRRQKPGAPNRTMQTKINEDGLRTIPKQKQENTWIPQRKVQTCYSIKHARK